MISFKVLTEDNRDELVLAFSEQLDSEGISALSEIVDGLSETEDVEYAVTASDGCVLIRVFDMGRYVFLYPYAVSSDADEAAAIIKINEYAVREEIPLVFSDVPRAALSELLIFRHMDIDAEDSEGESFSVKIKTECMLLDKIPQLDAGRVKLDAITEADIPLYAELSRSQNVNKYWGYDYSDDVAEPGDEYFFEESARDFYFGVAMSLAIRCGDEFCGEAVIYAFDGMGGAEFAIRLLPIAQGRGLGRCTVEALCELARKIGLVRLYSVIMKENERSVAMLDHFAFEKQDMGSSYRYSLKLD